MKIHVLQGLNNQNPGTTIIIELKENIDTKIIDKIQGFHTVFMDNYKLENKTLTVNSKLPHLWVEIGKALQKLSTRDWSEDYTNKYILETIIKKQVSSMSTIPLLHSAINKGLEITQLFLDENINDDSDLNRRYIIGCGAESQQICSFSSSKDTYLGFIIQRDKTLTNTILDRLGIQSPKWVEIKEKEDIKKYWNGFPKPVVIKPAGLTGGSGVTTKIETLEQAYKAFDIAHDAIHSKEGRLKYQYKILMQEQIEGEDYRLLVINGRFQIATKRVPAYVTGDGKNSIEKLIEITNQDPRRDITNPTHTLKPIIIDEALTDYLKDQNITLEYVPKKEERVYVRKVASMSKGGTTEDFTDHVHPQIKDIVESMAKSIHVFGLGVDLYCKDISKPLTKENGAILEVNTMPEAYLNAFPTTGKQYNSIGDLFLEELLGDVKTKRVVIIGKDYKQALTGLKLNLDLTYEKVGLYSNKKLFINEEVINDNVDTHIAFEHLKRNASLTTIAHHLTNDEFKQYGNGFERIDLVIVDSNESEILNILKGYENLGLISKIITN